MSSEKSLATRILDLPPSCVEICPWNSTYFAIGTYYLEKNEHDTAETKQKRSGSVLLFRLKSEKDSIELVQTYPTDYAILDLHFPIVGGDKCIWTANSTGSLTRYEIAEEEDFRITESAVLQLWDHETLVLSFTFHPKNSRVLGATLSDGSVVVCRLSEDLSTAKNIAEITKHDLEAWTMSFDHLGERCLSGGDDAALQSVSAMNLNKWSKEPEESDMQAIPLWKNRRVHSAGVTAILPLTPDIMVTGSYDDNLRVMALDKPPKVLAEENLEGGVWRLKLMHAAAGEDTCEFDVLASCMHAGARIVRVTLSKETPTSATVEVLARFEEHESMNYGSDFIRNDYEYTILSTSFYDKRLCLWKFRAPDTKDTPSTVGS